MKKSLGDVLLLIDRIYGAAAEETLWPVVLKEFRLLLGGAGSTLFFADERLKPVDSFFGDNVSSEAIASYQAHYHTVDIRLQRAFPDHANRIVTDGDLVDPALVERHEFYQDFLRPIGHRYIISAILDLGDGIAAFCSCHLGLQQEQAGGETLDRAAVLVAHLRRGLQLRRRLARVDATGQAALDVLDRLGEAVFLVDEGGRIVWQNVSADRLLNERDGLSSADLELRAATPQATRDLQRLIGSAIQAVSRPRGRPGGMMTIARPSLKRAYHVLATPLSRTPSMNVAAAAMPRLPVAAVFVTDPEIHPVPGPEVLAKLYKLTPAEAKLATALASGMSSKHYADQAKLSIHYVRWLVKQVEAKTDTRRIVDLIRLLTSQTGLIARRADDNGGSNS